MEFLELEILERIHGGELDGSASLRMRVTVRLLDFHGRHSEVWLLRQDLDDFVAQLRRLVETRKETAGLEAMSPDEFQLELRPIDRAGHYEAGVLLGWLDYSEPKLWQTTLRGSFGVAPDQLPHILLAFEELLAS